MSIETFPLRYGCACWASIALLNCLFLQKFYVYLWRIHQRHDFVRLMLVTNSAADGDMVILARKRSEMQGK